MPDNIASATVSIRVIRNPGFPNLDRLVYQLDVDEFWNTAAPILDLNATDPEGVSTYPENLIQ